MATKPDWARKKAFHAADVMGDVNEDKVAKLLRAERRRAVRIVGKAKYGVLIPDTETMTDDYIDGYQRACADILAALKGGK